MRIWIFNPYLWVGFWGCSNGDPQYPGRCLLVPENKLVASGSDTSGNKWGFELHPDKIELKCDVAEQVGAIEITGFIRDGDNNLRGGLLVQPVVTLGSGLSLDETNKEDRTDACGMAKWVIRWTCPKIPGYTTSGFFYAYSGSLISKTVDISVEHTMPPQAQQVVLPTSTTTTPTTPTTAPSP